MQFLSDIFIKCSDCNGRRYRPHILAIQIHSSPRPPLLKSRRKSTLSSRRQHLDQSRSIADLLDMTVDDAIDFLEGCREPTASKASQSLSILQEIGLGYLQIGQPINTLSGGESQRLKLARHLSDFEAHAQTGAKPAFFLFDEPTTGLHFEDVRILLKALQRLVDAGHSVVVIEHNLDVINTADWVIDLGPEAGAGGGRIVFAGPPSLIKDCPGSHTGRALAQTL